MRFGRQKTDAQNVEAAAATLRRDMERVWRAWKGYIAELRFDVAASNAQDDPEADLTGSGPAPRPRARLDAATRQEFGGVLESRRRQAQAQAEQDAAAAGRAVPDPEQVYARLLDQIAAELDGRARSDGQALIWYQGQLVEFDARALQAGTSDADYLSDDGVFRPTALQVGLALLALVVALWAVFWLVLPLWSDGPATAQTASAALLVGRVPVTPWAVSAAQLDGAPLALTPVPGSYPLRLCVGGELPRTASTLVLTGTGAVRRYLVTGPERTEAQAVLLDCADSPPRTLRTARLQETRTRVLLDPATLRRVVVRDASLDARIPQGQWEVGVEVGVEDAGAGVLVLPDGQPLAATRSEAIPGGTRLTYLVPAPSQGGPQAAGWELAGQAALPSLLPLTLPAPEPRAALLRRDVAIAAGAPRVAVQDGQRLLTLPLTLTLRAAAEPLALRAEDLAVRLSGSVGEARWTPPTLEVGKSVTVEVRIALDQRSTPIEVALAGWRARLSWDQNDPVTP